MKTLLVLLLVLLLFLGSFSAQAVSAKKILVVLSSEDKITLKEGIVHPTGFFLSELMVPVKGLIEAGYEPVFATPQGNEPVMDKTSDSAAWFGGDERKYQEIKRLFAQLDGIRRPLKLSQVRRQDLAFFAGIFIPGGHAPMEDLLINKDLGKLLRHFHRAKKPTALICHGPIALLSTLPKPVRFTQALAGGSSMRAHGWIYEDYSMTVFSTPEEQQEEPGQDNVLGGFVKFYPDYALRSAGGQVSAAGKWLSHVVRDRELITAQNPMSDVEFTKVFIQALSEQK